ncbi:MAG: hypothetical protein J7K40_11430, partial [candidate division Zixibacteria bacterium]|nr:hypothetical protein [candidate division Zixibacteria bacterium]
MITVPYKITLLGDKEKARDFIGAAQSQMRILENQISFQNLKQGARRVRLGSRTVVTALICFNLKEVKIYSKPLAIEIKKEGLEKLIPRFFAYIVKVNDITGEITRYYRWIYFVAAGTDMSIYRQTQYLSPIHLNDDYDIYVWSAGTENKMLEIMKNTPRGPDHLHKHPHRHTKAFMMDGRTDEEREDDLDKSGKPIDRPKRYVSACHVLTKNRKIVFMPLHAYAGSGVPRSDEICIPVHYPLYPLPGFESYIPYRNNIFFTGLQFPCPPRRFYCNPVDGVMVWYTTNPTDLKAENFIGGIIYDARNNAARTFIHYPSDADGRGFTAYWAVDRAAAEVPTPLIFDVQSLDKKGINVAITWSERPVNCYTNFSDSNVIYSELDSCDHIKWSGVDTGFEFNLFATLDQDLLIPEEIYEDEHVINPAQDCSINPNGEFYIKEEQRTYSDTSARRYHTHYEVDLMSDKQVEVISDMHHIGIAETCFLETRRCDHGVESTWIDQKNRHIQSEWKQQNTNTYNARWVCPNGLYFDYHKNNKYLDGFAYMWKSGCAGGPNQAEMEELCGWYGWDSRPHLWIITFAKCFKGYQDMPINNWNRIDSEMFYSESTPAVYHWDVTSDQDDRNSELLRQYQVDDDLFFSCDDVDHIYYLDDRATEDNQGLIAAGKGDSATGLYTDYCLGVVEYKSDYWKIYWK